MLQERWRTGFHLAPASGWLNDPNGLCRFRGAYHVFHQYSPDWPRPRAPRGWGHFRSPDLAAWERVGDGFAIAPDTPQDAQGAYSGSAVVLPGAAPDGGDLLRLYYTGNVKLPGDYDYVRDGREAYQILVESSDGDALSPKRVLLGPADYPEICTRHVRDPKVWLQDGAWWMALGARDVFDRGTVLLYRSDDGLAWRFASIVRSAEPFGFMWECPDRIELDGWEYLSFCPQGMQDLPWADGMRDQSGYVPLSEGETPAEAASVDTRLFSRWDHGFDFYAPQTFSDGGRTLLVGWMGMPEPPYLSAPGGLPWCHCLTVPRVLSRASDGAILQAPAPELGRLRGEAASLARPGSLELPVRADIEVEGVRDGFSMTLGGVLEVAFRDGEVSISFLDARPGSTSGAGAGRTRRSAPADAPGPLRVLVDGSAVEVFAAGGRAVFATRWFPGEGPLALELSGGFDDAACWRMGDGMERAR